MKLKTLIIVIAVTSLLVGVAWVLQPDSSRQTKDDRVGGNLIEREAVARLARIEFTETVDGSTETIVITKRGEGDWILPETHNLPVQFDQLSRLIRDLREATVERRVTNNPARIERLELGEKELKLSAADGTRLLHIIIGKQDDRGGRFYQFADEDVAFLTDKGLFISTRPDSWWAPKPFGDWELEDVRAAQISLLKEDAVIPFQVEREEVAADFEFATGYGADFPLSPDEVRVAVEALLDLNFNEIADADDPEVTEALVYGREFQLRRFDGQTASIRIGRRPGEKTVNTTVNAEGEAETETEEVPPGPAYALISFQGGDSAWHDVGENVAYRIIDYYFEQLPEYIEDVLASETGNDVPVVPAEGLVVPP